MNIKMVDMSNASFEQDLLDSVINTGFVVLTQHNIDHGLIKEAQESWKSFFNREQIFKNLFINGNNTNMGYKAIGTETAIGSKLADLKEFFHWRPSEDIPSETGRVTVKLFYQLENLGMKILSVLEKQTRSNYVWDCNGSANTILRTLHYPALRGLTPREGAVRAAAHEDINHITLLVASDTSGLQAMQNNGKWFEVPHRANTIVVNIGDMLALQSKGLYKSTTHRVINPTDTASDRISMPLFIHPHAGVELAPGYTAGRFLKERIDLIYGKKK